MPATTYDWAGTLALAQRLQPNARTVVIIKGTADTEFNVRRREALRPLLQNHEIKYLTGLPYDERLRQVSRLPRHSIVLLRRVFEDGSGRARAPELATDVSRASNAPVYSLSATYIGLGVVGSRMDLSVPKVPKSRIWRSTSCRVKIVRQSASNQAPPPISRRCQAAPTLGVQRILSSAWNDCRIP